MSATGWIHHIQNVNPYAKALYESGTRDEFLDAAERLLGRVVERMERSRATYRKLDERDLSKLIVELLGELVRSEAEAHSNGHVDVTIRHPRGLGFQHLTECKIWDGPSGHCGGMQQLLGYTTGREGRAMSLSFFIRHRRMDFLLKRLREQFGPTSNPPAKQPIVDHPFLSGSFITRHDHSSGFELCIVHLGCSLWAEGGEDLGTDGAD